MQERIILEEVANKAISLGLADSRTEVVKVLRRMVEDSARVTHYLGNRRFDDWVLKVESGMLKGIHLIQCHECDDRKRIPVYETCQVCGGAKCKECHFRGEVRRLIVCSFCLEKP